MWCRKNLNAISVFESIQKLKQNKRNLQKKTQPLIRGNKSHKMVAGAWGLECYWWRNGGLPAWGRNKSNLFNWTDWIWRKKPKQRELTWEKAAVNSWQQQAQDGAGRVAIWHVLMEKWVIHGEWNPMVVHLTLGLGNEGQQSTTSHASEYGTEGQTMFWIPNRGYGWLL